MKNRHMKQKHMKQKYMKQKHIVLAMVAALLTSIALSGCGNQIPELTEEEQQLIGEYAGVVMLRYDAKHRSRLLDITDEDIAAYEESKKPTPTPTPTPMPEPEKKPEEEPEEEQGTQPTVIDQTSGGQESIPVNQETAEEFLHLPAGVRIVYSGFSVADTYPDDDSSVFAMDASEGKRFLIVHMILNNESGSDQYVDLLSGNTSFRLTISQQITKSALVSMLTDDLSTFMDTIPAGQSANTVLIYEIPTDLSANITSLTLSLKNASNIHTIQLL